MSEKPPSRDDGWVAPYHLFEDLADKLYEVARMEQHGYGKSRENFPPGMAVLQLAWDAGWRPYPIRREQRQRELDRGIMERHETALREVSRLRGLLTKHDIDYRTP